MQSTTAKATVYIDDERWLRMAFSLTSVCNVFFFGCSTQLTISKVEKLVNVGPRNDIEFVTSNIIQLDRLTAL